MGLRGGGVVGAAAAAGAGKGAPTQLHSQINKTSGPRTRMVQREGIQQFKGKGGTQDREQKMSPRHSSP